MYRVVNFIYFFLIISISGCKSNDKEKINNSDIKNNSSYSDAKKQVGTMKLYPIDEGANDKSFFHFRENLIKAVDNKDASFILSVLDSNVILDYGGGFGKEIFIEDWRPFDSGSKLWAELKEILLLGGKFMNYESKKGFLAPYIFSAFPDSLQATEEVINYMAVISKKVHVYRKPNLTSEVIDTLNYDIIKAEVYEKDPENWLTIISNNGDTIGYIEDKFARGYTEMHIFFEKKNGKWIITEFLGGI